MAAWTTPPTFVAGGLTAAQLNTYLRDNLLAINPAPIVKTADQSINLSTTLTNDTHLLYTIGAAGKYIVDIYLYATSAANAAGDLAVGLSFPAGTCHFSAMSLDTTLASSFTGTFTGQGQLSATSGTTSIGVGLSTSTTAIHMHAYLDLTASGTVQLMWAQAASNANNSTLKAGSHMLVTQRA